MSLPPVPFWFLRHGETDWNARHLAQGSVDNPLNAVGFLQAETAARALDGVGIVSIVASPMLRTRQTAEVIGRVLGLPFETEEGLREASFGTHEGQPMTGWFSRWIAGEMTPEGGETFVALTDRAVASFTAALARRGPVLIVAHGALWRGIRGVFGLDPDVRTPNGVPIRATPGPAGWVIDPGG